MQRSAADTFSVTPNTSSQTRLTCLTWLRQDWRKKHGKATRVQYMPTDKHINQERLVSQKRILYHQTEGYMLFESVTVEEHYFTINELTDL